MAKQQKVPTSAPDQVIELAAFGITQEWLRGAQAQDVNGRGVVLANDRQKVTILHGQAPVGYTLSLYVQRDPITEEERAQVMEAADERKQTKAEKEAAELTKRERETKRAFELGQESTIGAMKNLSVLAQAAHTLGKLA